MKQKNPYYEEKLRPIVLTLPEQPGIYQYFDEAGVIIYIGKAKNLKKRVSSYFNKDSGHSAKVRVLVRNIANIRFMIVDTEMDALLLENNLIKKYQPRYNILLKDDKTYPWICIKKEPFPRVFYTRNKINDGSEYFGPYASIRTMHILLDLIKELYSLRRCNLRLTSENIVSGKFKVCLEYHIGNCKGPCEGHYLQDDYNHMISEIRHIIKGNINKVKQVLQSRMALHAEKMEFEAALLYKQKLDLLNGYQARSTVVSPVINNVDVFSIDEDEKYGYINFLKVVDGAIVQSHTVEVRKKLDESANEILLLVSTELRNRYNSDAREIILPFEPEIKPHGVTITIPQIGDKKKLLDLSLRNAKYYRIEKMKQKELVDPDRHKRRILERMQKDLRLPEKPVHIECFDNSNTQGSFPVASCVVFKDAKPSKRDYRHFNIKTVEGPNDYASMEEVLYRRYKRLLEEKSPLPQLIIVDGGKGQLSSGLASLEKLGLRGKITIVGIAKKLEEIYYPGDQYPLYIDKKSETLKVIQHLRDEAHRFGITHHRKRRAQGMIQTQLTEIPGIGPKTTEDLLRHFKSVKRIKEASTEELAQIIGASKAQKLTVYFSSKK